MKLSRQGLIQVAAVMVSAALLPVLGCASTGETNEERVRIVRPQEQSSEQGGIPPDKQADIQLLLQQRDRSTLKCYSDVLEEKHDRAFKGSVAVIVTLEPRGEMSKASDVKIVNSSLNNKEVHDCLIEKIKEFDFPSLDHSGSMQYVYHFQPAY